MGTQPANVSPSLFKQSTTSQAHDLLSVDLILHSDSVASPPSWLETRNGFMLLYILVAWAKTGKIMGYMVLAQTDLHLAATMLIISCSYHWALVVGPKIENGPVRGQRYHIRNQKVGGWAFASNRLIDVRVTVQLLARVTIAKIEDEERVIAAIRRVPVDPTKWDGQTCGKEPRWTCRVWLLTALKTIKEDDTTLGTNVLDDIDGIIETTKYFVARQMANRRYDSHAMEPKPVLDMITGEERYTMLPYKSKI